MFPKLCSKVVNLGIHMNVEYNTTKIQKQIYFENYAKMFRLFKKDPKQNHLMKLYGYWH